MTTGLSPFIVCLSHVKSAMMKQMHISNMAHMFVLPVGLSFEDKFGKRSSGMGLKQICTNANLVIRVK